MPRPAIRVGVSELDDALGVVHQQHQPARAGLAAQVDDAAQRRVVMRRFADLHELDAAVEVIDQLLVTIVIPPLDREVELPPDTSSQCGNTAPKDPSTAATTPFLRRRRGLPRVGDAMRRPSRSFRYDGSHTEMAQCDRLVNERVVAVDDLTSRRLTA